MTAINQISKGLRVLVVSSKPPEYSGNLGGGVVKALRNAGCNVEFLSLIPSERENDFPIYSILKQEPQKTGDRLSEAMAGPGLKYVKKVLKPFVHLSRNIMYRFSHKRKVAAFSAKAGFIYPDESAPPIDTDSLLNQLPASAGYDLIITIFWQRMLNSTSLRALYDRFKVPVYLYAVDMAPVSGGCFYFNSCVRYKSGCGKCPCLLSDDPHDRSHQNYLIKKANYSHAQIYYVGNSWMIERAVGSRLFDAERVLNISLLIDETVFYPERSESVRQSLHLPEGKDIILLVRSSNATRKGGDIIVHAAEYIQTHQPAEYLSRICWVTIGYGSLHVMLAKTGAYVVNHGVVNQDKLVSLYREASLFLNPSTDDAGPSMVNQSIMCGTPVVSFNLGTAVDVIENGISGFKTDDISPEGFYRTLEKAIRSLIEGTNPSIRETTRATALRHNTSAVFASRLLGHYSTVCSTR